MGNTDQPELGFYFLQAPQVKSSKAHIVFEMAEDSLNFGRAPGPQLFAFLAG